MTLYGAVYDGELVADLSENLDEVKTKAEEALFRRLCELGWTEEPVYIVKAWRRIAIGKPETVEVTCENGS